MPNAAVLTLGDLLRYGTFTPTPALPIEGEPSPFSHQGRGLGYEGISLAIAMWHIFRTLRQE
jgi:hypothetical protein